VSQGPTLRLKEVHPFGALRVAFSPAGDRLASGGLQGDIKIWHIPDGENLLVMKGDNAPVSGLAWLDEDHLVSADTHGRLRILGSTTGDSAIEFHTEPVTAMALLPWPARLVVGHATGKLHIYSLPDFAVLAEHELPEAILAIAVEPQQQWIAVATDERRVQLLDARLAPLRKLQTPPGKTFALRFAPDGGQLAGGGWFNVFLWSLAGGALEVRDSGHFGAIAALDYSPDGRQLVSIGRITNATVEVTDVATGQLDRRLSPQPLCGWDVRFSPDGHYIASSSEDGSVLLYDITTDYRPTWYHE